MPVGNWHFTTRFLCAICGAIPATLWVSDGDYTHDRKITINALDLFLSEEVKKLTNNRQTPTTTKPQTIQDFPIALK